MLDDLVWESIECEVRREEDGVTLLGVWDKTDEQSPKLMINTEKPCQITVSILLYNQHITNSPLTITITPNKQVEKTTF